jgi:hypothetical protein
MVGKRFAKRAAFMKRWLKRSLLHQQLPAHCKSLKERLLLFKEILTDLNCSDVAVEDDIIAGFKLTGWAPKTGVFHQMSEGLSSLCCRRWHLASTLRTMTISPVDQTTEHVWKKLGSKWKKGGSAVLARRM